VEKARKEGRERVERCGWWGVDWETVTVGMREEPHYGMRVEGQCRMTYTELIVWRNSSEREIGSRSLQR
jgi:hypothetical protein